MQLAGFASRGADDLTDASDHRFDGISRRQIADCRVFDHVATKRAYLGHRGLCL